VSPATTGIGLVLALSQLFIQSHRALAVDHLSDEQVWEADCVVKPRYTECLFAATLLVGLMTVKLSLEGPARRHVEILRT
jgi:hypothetical protein